ncbi:MAG: 50S ribosomal protein L4 [Gammaproteobacteria bacterium]|nr:50S ribosomal protein L4 [Gammaproteobacteria bacterium]
MELKTSNQGSVSVSDAVFGADFNETLVHQVVTAYLAGGRAGTSAQKTRSEVRGGGAKPWRQKGTGRARAGTSRSPIWTGGGATFAAKTRDYNQKVNRKMYRGAMRAILSKAAADGTLIVSDDLSLDAPRTRLLKEKLDGMNVSNALLLLDDVQDALYLASRNIPNIQVLDVDGVDPVSLVRHSHIVANSAALKKLEERFGE